MGVIDAMQHMDSSRTIASLNGSHSEERLGRLPMGSKECSFHNKYPKLKRRRTSAVRDFPPGCGRFAQLNLRPDISVGTFERVSTENLVSEEKNGNGHDVEKLILSSSQVDERVMNDKDVVVVEQIESLSALEHKLSDFPENLHPSKILGPVEEAAAVDTAEPLTSSGKNGDGQGTKKPMVSTCPVDETVLMSVKAVGTMEAIESLTALENGVSSLLRIPHQLGVVTPNEETFAVLPDENYCSPPKGSVVVSSGNDMRRTVIKKYPPRRTVSAVRDFPPLCGRNASLEARIFGQERSAMGDEPSSSDKAKTNVRQTGEDVQDEEFHRSELGVNVSDIIGDEVQPKGKEHVVQEIERQDEGKVNSKTKVVLNDTRKKGIERSQESNECQGMEDFGHLEENVGKEMVVYHGKESLGEKCFDVSYSLNQLHEEGFESSEPMSGREIVLGLMAASNCPWKKEKVVCKRKPEGGISESKQKKLDSKSKLARSKTAARTKLDSDIGGKSPKNIPPITQTIDYQGTSELVIWDEEYSLKCDQKEDTSRSCFSDVCPPPFGHGSSINKNHDNDAVVTRNKVREVLRLFQALCRKILHEEEGKSKEKGTSRKRIDLSAAAILKKNDRYVNTGKQILGLVPGVEVGDEFHYRVELTIIGLHRQIQGGIDYVKHGGKILATSIVASGGYADDLDNSNSLIYTGQGGNVMCADKEPEDQKLERGNLALKNSLHEKNPVRVIRGAESSDGKSKTYVYDGLYLVEKCWQDMGSHGKLVFKFQLDRIQDQPELAWKEVKKSKKFQVRKGLCIDDISLGKEPIPICAVNTLDDENPPPFIYITSMLYPDWCRPIPPKGCSCVGECSDSENCSCAVKNGGEIPYNFNGSIVEAKSLVYECGPSCKCPPSCYNRVSQHGIKFQLEIFKTESRGWGVRSLNSIPSGSFICEYMGELLEEKEAEERTGNDEYLFDIGNNYNDNSLWDGLSSLLPDVQSTSYEVVGDGGFTIDAVQYGNVGRFINHSCSPNLYAQNVLFDHDDSRIPHIMFFAAENIPPLQELTYHYNYTIDQVRDSKGNIRKKNCYCGSSECTGRLY